MYFFFQSDMFTMESVDRVQKAVTMPVYKNDAHNDVEVSLFRVINIMRSTGLKKNCSLVVPDKYIFLWSSVDRVSNKMFIKGQSRVWMPLGHIIQLSCLRTIHWSGIGSSPHYPKSEAITILPL